ncbi:hypothetical protein ABZ387_00020 [Streptomyces flaveolus]|uniref:hypothetical protein n=1 Tax=Streptomyces flaveolus TaxID=67297 RepID=UPI00340DF9F2
MAEDVLHLHTTLSVEAIKEIFGSTLQLSRKVEFGTVRGSDNPFVGNADFHAYASLKTVLGGWLVQIYVTDRTDSREVRLVAAGSSALGRAWSGLRNAYSLSDSREKAAAVREQLRSADTGLRTV